ncbi:hypothetical protein A2U01_0025014 [Trifolium medium]|uniref:Uncharacterized protein n=1 Tax=Trifolium medium TaxID=97028 RepID=A0A392NVY1_9FABA|nr:hypothetical protein [Trifolium medium]
MRTPFKILHVRLLEDIDTPYDSLTNVKSNITLKVVDSPVDAKLGIAAMRSSR